MHGLVRNAPNGAFVFVSQLYTGSISDRELVVQSGLMPLLEDVPAGKSDMTDEGLKFQDLPVKSGLLLNVPSLKGSPSFDVEDVRKHSRLIKLQDRSTGLPHF